MQKSELPNACVQSPELNISIILSPLQIPDCESLGALLVRVLLLPGSLPVDLCTLLAQRLLDALEPGGKVILWIGLDLLLGTAVPDALKDCPMVSKSYFSQQGLLAVKNTTQQQRMKSLGR